MAAIPAANGLLPSLRGLLNGNSAITSGGDAHVQALRLMKTCTSFLQPAESAASDTTAATGIWVVPDAAKLVRAYVISSSTATANDTTYATITLLGGVSGTMGTTLATMTTKTSASGGTGNWAAKTKFEFTISADTLAAGDLVGFSVAKASTGVQLPAFRLCLTFVED